MKNWMKGSTNELANKFNRKIEVEEMENCGELGNGENPLQVHEVRVQVNKNNLEKEVVLHGQASELLQIDVLRRTCKRRGEKQNIENG